MGASPRDRATLRLRLGLLIGGLLVAGAAGAQEAAMQDEAGRGVTFRWWGQACYSVTDADGRAVLVDPFPKEFGYAPPTVTPLVVLISHEHRDHNAVDNVPGQPAVLRGAGDHEAAGLTFRGVATWHDAQQGAQRGPNTVFTWSVAGLKVAHLGDLGHLLSDEQIAAIGPVDVLLIPVGGYYTIDATQAVAVARQLQAKAILPMHVKTAAVARLPVGTLDDFLKVVPADWSVVRPETVTWTVRAAELTAATPRVVVMKYE